MEDHEFTNYKKKIISHGYIWLFERDTSLSKRN